MRDGHGESSFDRVAAIPPEKVKVPYVSVVQNQFTGQFILVPFPTRRAIKIRVSLTDIQPRFNHLEPVSDDIQASPVRIHCLRWLPLPIKGSALNTLHPHRLMMLDSHSERIGKVNAISRRFRSLSIFIVILQSLNRKIWENHPNQDSTASVTDVTR